MRCAGVLLPVSALPSPYGIGTLGASAREFIDFLSDAKQTYWQVLPLGPTGFGDSPYQSFSTFAANPYLVDLDELIAEGLLTKEEVDDVFWGDDVESIDYGLLFETRFGVLRKAYERVEDVLADEFHTFCEEEASWLDDYSLFMALKFHFNGQGWQMWPEEYRTRRPQALEVMREMLAENIDFWKAVQFFFFRQWHTLKAYAHAHGIQIIGDVPIYVAEDSVDVWSHPELFQLDEHFKPIEVAGCPPDGFSATGQLWGNPLFDWEKMSLDGYAWWMQRVKAQFRLFDVLRIDHFRGFDSYYAIPYGSKDACHGRWRKGPGYHFFEVLKAILGDKPIIAEDLGFLTESVVSLLHECGYPGMKVLEFGFDSRDEGGRNYQPHHYPTNSVAYVGTHDNSTALGWLKCVDADDAAYARSYMRLSQEEGESWGMMRTIWQSPADTAIVQMQDALELDDRARINVPSTLGTNWKWRMSPNVDLAPIAARMASYVELYERSPQANIGKDTPDVGVQHTKDK